MRLQIGDLFIQRYVTFLFCFCNLKTNKSVLQIGSAIVHVVFIIQLLNRKNINGDKTPLPYYQSCVYAQGDIVI